MDEDIAEQEDVNKISDTDMIDAMVIVENREAISPESKTEEIRDEEMKKA